MDFELRINNSSDVEVFHELPGNLKRFDKLESECMTVLGNFGNAWFYQFSGNGVTVRYSIYDMLLNTVMRARSDQKALELRIAIENQIGGVWEGIDRPSLAANHFSLGFTPFVQTRAEFIGGRTYATCDFHFKYSFLVEMASDFPVLAEFIESVEKGKAANITGRSFVCTTEMNDAIRFVEKNPYSARSQKYLVENRAKEILLSALERMADIDADQPVLLDSRTIEALQYGKRLIELNVGEELSLDYLCRKTGLNEYKFKKGFKTLFRKTAIDYHISLKMELAKRLLLDTDKPIAEIAYTLSYHHASNFTIEFKRRFGYTPNHFRKHGKK